MLFSQATFVVALFVCLDFLFVLGFVWVSVCFLEGFLRVCLSGSNFLTIRFIDRVCVFVRFLNNN